MFMIFSDQNATRHQAIVLAASEASLRLAVKEIDDAVEFRRVYGRWVSTTGEEIEIEAIVPESNQAKLLQLSEPAETLALAVGAGEYWMA